VEYGAWKLDIGESKLSKENFSKMSLATTDEDGKNTFYSFKCSMERDFVSKQSDIQLKAGD